MLNRYNQLLQELKLASEAYYYAEKPIMTDYDYDQKFIELQEIEKNNPELISSESPTQRPGASIKVARVFKTGVHTRPMLSLKTETDYTANGAMSFVNRVRSELRSTGELEYVAELKFDGLGIDLTYTKGTLTRALTRGDGEVGEDVTENVKYLRRIPKHIFHTSSVPVPETIIVRGEIFMSHESFTKANIQRGLDKKDLYVNARNAAAGALRVLDPSVTGKANLSFFAYTLIEATGMKFATHYESLMYIGALFIPVCEHTKVCKSADELIAYHEHIANIRDKLGFDIDGVVYKVNNLKLQEQLGYSGREPKWAVAHKYPAQTKSAKILAIDIQVGRTGKLTPVARIEPTFVGGTTITNVTLHNEGEILRKDVRVNDTVIVRRAGDVIPEIVGPINMDNAIRSPSFKMVLFCPECNSPVTKEVDQADYRCTGGLICPAQRLAGIIHFTQKAAVEVSGLGEAIIAKLLEAELIKDVSDLYKISVRDIMTLDKMAETSASNLFNAIEQSKHTTLRKFLFGLGIRNAGEGTSKRLVEHFKTLPAIMSASVEQLLSIKDIGPTVANSVYNFFNDNRNKAIIASLLKSGVYWDDIVQTNRPLVGKNYCITGSLFNITREDATTKLEALGAKVQSSVSKHTTALFSGPNAGSKLAKANDLNIPILNETDLIDLLNKTYG